MSYLNKKLPFSVTVLAFTIASINSSYIQAADPMSRDLTTNITGWSKDNTSIDISNSGKIVELEWNSFDISGGETFEFIQMDTSSVVMNNINDNSASKIFGTIKANGHVFLVNNNGFTFGENAVIDTQGFLATTFDADFIDNKIQLTDGGTGTIELQDLDILNNTRYAAFYSRKINLTGTIQDSTDNSNIILSTQGHSLDTITLPGIGIDFDATAISESIEESLLINDNSLTISDDYGKIISEEGSVYLNTNDINTLLNSNIKLPNQIKAKSLTAFINNTDSSHTTEITDNLNFNNKIDNLTFVSTGDITVKNYISGSNLNLTFKANNITIDESSDSSNGYLGGITGLKSISLAADGVISISDSITVSDSLSLLGNVNISNSQSTENSNNDEIKLQADNKIIIQDIYSVDSIKPSDHENENLSDLTKTDLIIITNDLTIGNLKTNFANTTLSSNNITLNDNKYNFNNAFTIKPYDLNKKPTVNIKSSVNFFGNSANFNNARFNLLNENIDVIFSNGLNSNGLSNLSLENISMSDTSHGFNSLELYLNESASSIDLSGDITTKKLSLINKNTDDFDINVSDSLLVKGLLEFDISNAKINATDNVVSIVGNGQSNSKAYINDINSKELDISGFEDLQIYGSELSTQSGNLNLDTNSISLKNNDLSLKSDAGKIQITSNIDANKKSISIESGTGGFKLSGISNANDITITNSTLTNINTEQSLKGNYSANGIIDMSSLNHLGFIGEVNLSANKIDFSDTNINSNSDILLSADLLTLDKINAASLNINNGSIYSSELILMGDLITKGSLNLDANSIVLNNDITLEGDINLLNKKELSDNGLLYSETSKLVPTISGLKHLTMNAKNKEAYLYDFGKTTPLASFTLNGEGTLHMVGRPNLSGSSGLSILGNWDWDLLEPYSFITENQDLNLSGVNLNTVGSLTFETGSGSLSLGNIGSKGTVTDVIINEAGTLNLHGDIKLVGSEFGYDFSKASNIMLHKNTTLGSTEEPSIVNLGNVDIDGTFDLNIYSNDISLGDIGSNIALQSLNIYSGSDLVLNNSINLVGNANISANSIAINQDITSTGLDINLNATSDITMSKVATLNADYGNISLKSEIGNIGLGAIDAKTNVFIEASTGRIFNAIDDYKSNDLTSINITSDNLTLLGKAGIGESLASPIVIKIENKGIINTESDGNIYIANLSNAGINSQGRVIDTTSKTGTAIIDAYNLFQLSSINSLIEPHYKTTLSLIENSNWEADTDESVKTIKTPNPSPNLYYSRKGWRLGY